MRRAVDGRSRMDHELDRSQRVQGPTGEVDFVDKCAEIVSVVERG